MHGCRYHKEQSQVLHDGQSVDYLSRLVIRTRRFLIRQLFSSSSKLKAMCPWDSQRAWRQWRSMKRETKERTLLTANTTGQPASRLTTNCIRFGYIYTTSAKICHQVSKLWNVFYSAIRFLIKANGQNSAAWNSIAGSLPPIGVSIRSDSFIDYIHIQTWAGPLTGRLYLYNCRLARCCWIKWSLSEDCVWLIGRDGMA